jgi:hypothetical protein
VLWLAELQSVTAVQRRSRAQYGRQPPIRKSIRFWNNKVRTTDSRVRVIFPGTARTSEENASRIRETLQRSPHKSIRAASLQLQIPRSTHKRLRPKSYKIQMIINAPKLSDQVRRTNFSVNMQEIMDVSSDFLRQMCFSDEATFNVIGVGNRYNCRIWGSQNPHVTRELERGTRKENLCADLMHTKSDSFSFQKRL